MYIDIIIFICILTNNRRNKACSFDVILHSKELVFRFDFLYWCCLVRRAKIQKPVWISLCEFYSKYIRYPTPTVPLLYIDCSPTTLYVWNVKSRQCHAHFIFGMCTKIWYMTRISYENKLWAWWRNFTSQNENSTISFIYHVNSNVRNQFKQFFVIFCWLP